ncbi:hypothetical protein LEP1GSC173_1392 [Leptospira interrogans str. HAI1594]|uniref:Uncharacterized protein n=1 Tax=Leptospira interrogans serovar Hardjo str. Norma TaxID=1279460 RepID=A0A0M5L7Q6_LEPIR|nr:hypothetical protein LIL_12155 [Leptospira interrogans serovar Linhai str. 56609]ALE39128.1 hypothetical protein G436_1940 [Leptospira interrogans serovar Hardjo str. Norma]EKP75601.1 hypothetical protein LEP1GSC173_1392 [Leptospira interrogans str. HAI1594]
MMWELLQTTILQTNSKIVETYTFRKFFSFFVGEVTLK